MSQERSDGPAHRVAGFLSFAASPVFAMMALFTFADGARAADLICAVTDHGLPLSGMTAMYALMSAFHCAPWLRLASRPRSLSSDLET